MKITLLEEKLKAFEEPLRNPFAKWLYLHFPPRPIVNKKMHDHYLKALEILMEQMEESALPKPVLIAIREYIRSVAPLLEVWERKQFPFSTPGPEEMLEFLMEENNLSQYDLASDFGGQSVVSDVLNKKRKMTREQIERLSRRFGISPATFFPAELNDPTFRALAKSRLNEPEAIYGARIQKPLRKKRKK